MSEKQKARPIAASQPMDANRFNGWEVRAHPCFFEQIEKLDQAVNKLKTSDPKNWSNSPNAKLLGMIRRLAWEDVPLDPANPKYRQGNTLGPDRKHWFRAKCGGGRFRLFFRFSSVHKIIIYAWVNDERTLRTYGGSTDAYKVFESMLNRGNPPDDWETLVQASKSLPSNPGDKKS